MKNLKIKLALGALFAAAVYGVADYHGVETKRVAVNAAERDPKTKEYKVFHLKWNSADIQNTFLAAAKTQDSVDVRYYGWRMPFFSVFPNVTTVAPVPKK